MIYRFLIFSALVTAILSTQKSFAEDLVDIKPDNVFVPTGFDDNDQIVVVLDGYLPDTCHKIAPAFVRQNNDNTVTVQARAIVYPGNCDPMKVPYQQVVNLGIMKHGTFAIIDRKGTALEPLQVAKATSSSPDDYFYMPVDSAEITIHDNVMYAIIKGRYTTDCSGLDWIKLINSGRVFELLPVMKQSGVCHPKESPFEYTVEIPKLPPGHYLLHVRSLNGQSVNQVFSNIW